jgi:peptidoglycan/LPS O-acetylase OafA/YrhL
MVRYLGKRILRTFPAYAATVLIALSTLVPFFENQSNDASDTLWVHALFLQDYLGSDLVAAFWSLGVEEKFYLLCPLVLVHINRLKPRRQLVVLALLAMLPMLLRLATISSNQGQFINYSHFFWSVRSPFHLAMDGLWVGVICAMVHANLQELTSAQLLWLRHLVRMSIVVFLTLLLSVPWLDSKFYYASSVVLAVSALAFGGIVLGSTFDKSPAHRVLRTTWLRALSTISYSVYLVHLMFVPLALELAERILPTANMHSATHFLAFAAVFLVLSLSAGLTLHFAVEKPFLMLKDRIRL